MIIINKLFIPIVLPLGGCGGGGPASLPGIGGGAPGAPGLPPGIGGGPASLPGIGGGPAMKKKKS